MPRTQRLDPAQRRAVEHLARHQGCVCMDCGSSGYLKSNNKAVQYRDHIGVASYCTNEEHLVKVLALGEPFALTFDQAKAIGLQRCSLKFVCDISYDAVAVGEKRA